CPIFGRPVRNSGSPVSLRPGTSPQALQTLPRGRRPALRQKKFVGPRDVTPGFGYESPSPKLSGTLTHLMIVLPRTHYVPLGLPSCGWLTSPLWLIEHPVTKKKKKLRAGEGLPSSLHLLSCHADPFTPEDSSLPLQDPSSFRGFRPYRQNSASSCKAFLTTRQDSLHVTAWHVARPVSDRYFRRYAFTHGFRRTQVS
ncbi:hypothetical protein DFP98_1261, partial [Cohnella phaseoli]